MQFCTEVSFLPRRISLLTLSILMSSVLTIMHVHDTVYTSVQVLGKEAKQNAMNMNTFCSWEVY